MVVTLPASFEAAPSRVEVEPQRQQVNAFFAEMHEARAGGDVERFERFSRLAEGKIWEYVADQIVLHPNRAWIEPTLWGSFFYARGEMRKALQNDEEAYAVAETPEQKCKSAYNLSNELRALGQVEEALQRAKEAVAYDPALAPPYVNLVLCLAADGQTDEANRTLGRLVKVADFSNEEDPLAAALRYERELHESGLPAANELRQRFGK
jgi:tetratricopeptide (TPR) repeat protein